IPNAQSRWYEPRPPIPTKPSLIVEEEAGSAKTAPAIAIPATEADDRLKNSRRSISLRISPYSVSTLLIWDSHLILRPRPAWAFVLILVDLDGFAIHFPVGSRFLSGANELKTIAGFYHWVEKGGFVWPTSGQARFACPARCGTLRAMKLFNRT